MSSSALVRVWASFVVLTVCIVGTAWATQLQAVRSGNNVTLSWQSSAAADFYVQVATNVVDPMEWRIDTNAISVAGETCSVTTVPAGAQRFYRLKAWEVLFDGTSTAVFRGYRQAAFPDAEWTVTPDGQLKTVFGSPAGHIITTNQYDDFELLWDWRAGTGGNGGVLYRVTEYYDQPYKSASEYQLIDDSGYSLPGKQQLGAVYGLIAPTNRGTVSPSQWNQCRLLVQGNHVEHWLNGRRIAQFDFNSPAFNSLVAGSTFSSYTQFGKASKGFIAFQNWTPEIWYRNIRLRPLPSAP